MSTLTEDVTQGEPTRTHLLKTWPGPFAALLDGTKTFELRQDDRAYAVGDILVLAEWDPAKECGHGNWNKEKCWHCMGTGRKIRKLVTYRCSLAEWVDGAPRGWVVLGLGEPL